MEHVAYVGRQALFDRDGRTVGYELLFRDSDENRARFDDGDQASATTMLNAAVELGLDTLAGDLPVWVNLTTPFLTGVYPIPLPSERTVIEVVEDVPVTPALLVGLRALRARGFTIALDDYVLTDATRPLLAVADRIKIDVLGLPGDEIARQYQSLVATGLPLIAEKLSSRPHYEECHALGFDMFQGHYLELPSIAKTRRLPHDRARLIQILGRLYDPAATPPSLESTIAAELGLSVRLLRLAGASTANRGAPVGTVGEAIGSLGIEATAGLVTLILIAGFDDKPMMLARHALIRARMCELLARDAGLPPGELFTAGLLSLIDGVLDRPLPELLGELPITPTIAAALLGDRDSQPARIVEAARSHDRGHLDRVAPTGLAARKVFSAWYDAIQWAEQLIAAL